MNYTLKLAIPLALGVAAFVVNMMVLKAGTAQLEFVRVRESATILEGQPITKDLLEAFACPKNNAGSLIGSAIPWSEHGVLLDVPAERTLLGGDIVFYRDIEPKGEALQLFEGESSQMIDLGGVNVAPSLLQINNHLDFLIQLDQEQPAVWVGPFRLVSVGNRVSNSSLTSGTGSAASTISVAVRGDLEKKTNLTAEEQAQLERQQMLDKFAEKEKQNLGRLLNVRFSPTK